MVLIFGMVEIGAKDTYGRGISSGFAGCGGISDRRVVVVAVMREVVVVVI